jgi:hypothetical protein
MEEQNSFDEFFRESLADYRETPPPAAWETVAARLDEDDRRRRRGFFYWPWVALSLLLMVGGAWWLYGWINGGPGAVTSGKSGAHYVAAESGSDLSGGEGTPTQAQSVRQSGSPSTTAMTPSQTGTRSGPATPGDHPVPAANTDQQASTGNSGKASTQRIPEHSAGANGLAAATGNEMQASSGRIGKQPATPRNHMTSAGSRRSPIAARAASADAYVHGTRIRPSNTERTEAHAAQVRPEQPAGTSTEVRSTARQQALLPALAASRPVIVPADPTVAGGNERRDPTSGMPALAAAMPAGTPAPLNQRLPGMLQAPNSTLPFTGSLPSIGISPSPKVPGPAPLGQPEAAPEPLPAPAPTVIEPAVLMLAIEPVMHFFAGAALPPVIGLYETGLLDPERYQPPVEPVVPIAAIEDPAAAPAMLPADSNTGPAKTAMSLSAFLGYERGIKTPPRNMFTVGLSLLWQLSEKFSIGLQPALVYGNLPRTDLTADKAYQRSSTDVTRFVTRQYSPSVLGQFDTVNNYVIREAFDSIIVRGTYLKGSLWQLELPLILQFNPFGPAFRVYGGPSMYFGGSMKIQSDGPKQTYTIDRKDSVVQSVRMTEEQLKNYFGKSGLESYSNYDPNANNFDKLDPIRFGYQFGVGFQKNRMSIDLSVRQQLSGYHQLSPALQQLYMNPVFRFGFGYMLLPQRVRQAKPITQ